MSVVDRLARTWLDRHHGLTREAHQYDFYRCLGCRRVVTWRRIKAGGCGCGSARISPAILTRLEKVRLLCLPWQFQPAARDLHAARGVVHGG